METIINIQIDLLPQHLTKEFSKYQVLEAFETILMTTKSKIEITDSIQDLFLPMANMI